MDTKEVEEAYNLPFLDDPDETVPNFELWFKIANDLLKTGGLWSRESNSGSSTELIVFLSTSLFHYFMFIGTHFYEYENCFGNENCCRKKFRIMTWRFHAWLKKRGEGRRQNSRNEGLMLFNVTKANASDQFLIIKPFDITFYNSLLVIINQWEIRRVLNCIVN